MADNHHFLWLQMIRLLEEKDIRSMTVLDFGCNQGGFLRLLYDQKPFKFGYGVDIAQDSVTAANILKEDRPLSYEVCLDLSQLGKQVELAFSHEVLYLLADLRHHAEQINAVLKPGGIYYAALGCHTGNPFYARWKPKIAKFNKITMPQDHSLNDVADSFAALGYEISVRPFSVDSFIRWDREWFQSIEEQISYYSNFKMLFRLQKPQC